jgi:spore germination protein PC
MYMNQFQAYFQMMEQRIRSLEDRCLIAERELQTMKENLKQLRPVHIDAINYKVQELAVQELSGTLNVGLTALSDAQQLESWLKQSDAGDDKNIVMENLQNELQSEWKEST